MVNRISTVVCLSAFAWLTTAATSLFAADSSVQSKRDSDSGLEEIIVTAEKREERLEDVPAPVSVVNTTELTDSAQFRLQDYYMQVPGLSVAPGVQSTLQLSLRGIATGPGPATVAIALDDVPFGATGDTVVPDFDPGDLERIEVLRGPQGTLYGASGLGGLIKFVTKDPSTNGLSGRVEAGTNTVYNSDGIGYNVRGSVNVPLTDDLAVRLSGFTREDPGYIDNPVQGRDGVNEDHAAGVHASLLWKPTDAFSLKFSALYQSISGGSTSESVVAPGLGPLQQNYVPDAGPYTRDVQAYDLVLNGQVGPVHVTSVTGFNVNQLHDSFDATAGLGSFYPILLGLSGVAETGAPVFDKHRADKFSQELRVTWPLGERVDALIGGFYTHEYSPYSETLPATDLQTGAFLALAGFISFPTTYTESAGFGSLTFHATDKLSIEAGLRDSHIENSFASQQTGPLLGDSVQPKITASSNALTYLLTPEYKLTDGLMVYARLASGYRPGGPNVVPTGAPIPSEYQPDKTYNYDVGLKGNLIDHQLTADISLYYIDWRNIQLGLSQTVGAVAYGYTGNGSRAKSEGIELSLEWRPIQGFKVGGWVAYNDAELTEDFPSTANLSGVSGDRLPGSSRVSGNLTLDKEFKLTGEIDSNVGVVCTYVGNRLDVFNAGSPERQYLPPYARTDVHADVRYHGWTYNLFANNLTNRYGLISGGVGNPFPDQFYYIQPRVIGLSVAREF